MKTTPTDKLEYNLRSGGKVLWIIATAGLLLRWGNLLLLRNSDLTRLPIIDSAFYHQWAQSISRGNVIGEGIFFMSPLYPYFMGLIYTIFGSAPWLVLLVQGLLGAGSVLLLYRWSARIAGRRAGLIAAGLGAIYAPFIFYDGVLLTSSLIIFFSALILNLTESVITSDRKLNLWLLGLCIGFSVLTRPLVMIFLPFIYLILLRQDRETAFRKSGWITAAMIVVLIPVGARNLIVGKEFTLTTSSAGMNFFVGNNPEASGIYWEAPFLSSVEPQYEDEEYRRVASEAVGRVLTTREAGRYWMNQSLDWIVHEPHRYLALVGRKLFYFWNRAEFANNVSIYMGRAESPLLKFNIIGFWLIAPLGLAGLIRLWKRKGWESAQTAWLWVIAYMVGCMMFFVSSEYRLPAVLPLLLGAGFLIDEISSLLKDHKTENAMKFVALALVFLPFTNFRTNFIYGGENPRMDYFNMGNTLMKMGRETEAIDRFQRCLTIDPYFAEALLSLAQAYYRTGHADKAIEIGKRAGLEDPESILTIIHGEALREAYYLLEEGKLGPAMKEFAQAGWDNSSAAAETTRVSKLRTAQEAYRNSEFDQAIELFKEVNQSDRIGDSQLLHNLAFIYWQTGQADSAEYYVLKSIRADSSNIPTLMLGVRIFNAIGKAAEADRLLEIMDAGDPRRMQMLERTRDRMDSLTALGQWEKALNAYAKYGRLGYEEHPEDKLRLGRLQLEVGNHDRALQLLETVETSGLVDPNLYVSLGRTLAALGRIDEAMAQLQRAISLDPESIIARVSLARLYLSLEQPKRALGELQAVDHLLILNEKLRADFEQLHDSLTAKL